MKKTILILAASVAAFAQQGVQVSPDGAVRSQIGQDARNVVIQGGGNGAQKIEMNNGGPGVFCAAISQGGTCSFYRNINGERREWLRIGVDGIQLVTPNGLVPAFSGRVRPGCAVDYLEGIAIGEVCQ